MSSWVRRWEVAVRWRPGLTGDRLTARRVDSVAQLRQMVTWARAHPDITAVRHHTVRELIGRPPAACPRGHLYDGGSATRVVPGWKPCGCGGHIVLACRWPGCGDVSLDPPLDPECGPTQQTAPPPES